MTEIDISRQITDLQHLAKRMKLWGEAQDAFMELVLANTPELKEPGGGSTLMKFRRNTWMPISEAHFVESVNEDGSYQGKAYERSLKFVQHRGVAVDVGANIGLWAKRMSSDFDTVLCFEPQSIARACLARNVTRNNVVIYPFALGAEPGEATITINRLAIGGGMIPITDDTRASMLEKYPTTEERARVVTLDSLSIKPDYIKIDVQGFEPEVLRGAEKTIRAHKPTIICEAGGQTDKISGVDQSLPFKILADFGYRVADRVGKDSIFTP